MPFYTWLPSAYAEAPTGTSMLLTGAMSKMGVYGFCHFLASFPRKCGPCKRPCSSSRSATSSSPQRPPWPKRDLKRMVAYPPINHVGYCLLGIFAAAQLTGDNAALDHGKARRVNGVMLQMFNHGLTASALFYFVGLIEQRSGGLARLDDFGGLRKAAPVFCGLMGITLFASLGLPGLNGFVSEFLIFKGALPLAGWAAAISILGLLHHRHLSADRFATGL